MSRLTYPEVPKGTTCTSQLRDFAQEDPDRPAYVFFDVHLKKTMLSRKDVWDKSRKFAAMLRRHGIKKGEVVCNTLVNSPEKILSALGTVVAGAVSMHGQILLADGEDLIHNCKNAKCYAIIVDPRQAKGALPILESIQHLDEVTGELSHSGLPDLKKVIKIPVCSVTDEESLDRGLKTIEEEEEMFEETNNITEDNLAYVFSTSGTTGFSKQVPHTHRSCVTLGRVMGSMLGIESKTSKCFLDRCIGWIGGFPGPYLAYGCTRVLTDLSKGVPQKLENHSLQILNELEIDCGLMVPALLDPVARLVKSGKKLNKRLRAIASGGAPLTKGILDAIGVVTDSINASYGMTECGFVASLHVDTETPYEDYCVGTPMEGYDVQILDDQQNELPAGKTGCIAIRGPTTTNGYLGNPEKTKASFTKDGYFLIGDAGYKNDKGQLFVLGRQADAISRGSYIHYPGWLEARIRRCPGVESIAVIGVPDPVYHEEICACVIPSKAGDLTTEKFKEYCDSLILTEKCEEISPNVTHVLMFESFPHNRNGKLDKKALWKEACERLGIENK